MENIRGDLLMEILRIFRGRDLIDILNELLKREINAEQKDLIKEKIRLAGKGVKK